MKVINGRFPVGNATRTGLVGLGLGLVIPLILACGGRFPVGNATRTPAVSRAVALRKINLDLTQISPAGLIGPPDGLRSLSYELCVPATAGVMRQVQAIDPSLQFYPRSPGRIGCRADQVLAIGNTHQPRWRRVLIQLAQQPYVAKIEPFWGE